MYQQNTEKQLEELTSLIKALDTKIGFIMDDVETLKTTVESINETVIQTAINLQQSVSAKSHESDKTARLEAFKQQTARW
jgi:hypothetical protein